MLQRFFIGILLILIAARAAQLRAQAPSAPQIMTQEQLTIRIAFEDDRPVPPNLRVELLSIYGSSVEIGATDTSGTVRFTRLTPAKYKVRITGDGVVTTESSEIDMTDSGPSVTEFVHVRRVPVTTDPAPLATIDVNIPSEARKEFDKASEKMDQKNWNDAKTHLERAIAIYPKYALAHNNLALIYVNLNQGEKAVESFRAAAQLDEHLPQANLYLGHFYYDNKDYKQAEPYLLHSATAEPRNPQILTALANAQMQNGEPEQALANAQKVHSIPDHKKFAIAHLIAAQVLNDRGEKQRAREEYGQFLREDPDSPMAARVKDALSKLDTASK
jgi:tetratricopeptide (TPR) repeat protein